MSNIYEKLMSIQSFLKVPKGRYSEYGKYSYRSCEDIVEAVKPLLYDAKLILVLNDEIENIGDRYYIIATASVIDCESGEKISSTARAREESERKGFDAPQITGGTSSYARKYALNGLFCIDDSYDPDSFPDCQTNQSDTQVEIQTERVKSISEELTRTGYGMKALNGTMTKKYGETDINKLSNLQFSDLIKKLRSLPDKVEGS